MTNRIVQLLQQRIGMDINSIGQQTFLRVLALQLRKFNCSIEHYCHHIQHSNEMWTSLVEAVVIPETWFFRYPESFQLFAHLVQQKWLQLSPSRPLKVLCVPCSSGEEPYSLAMTLLQQGFTPAQFCIDAIDINAQILQQARIGLYRDYAFRTADLSFREQFFSSTEQGYQLSAKVRECVSFSYGNLLEPGSIPTQSYDFVFCRNLLIYFDQPTQQQAVRQLHLLLAKDGFLFSGPAEAGAFARFGMMALDRRECFAFANPPKQSAITDSRTMSIAKTVTSQRAPGKKTAATPIVSRRKIHPAQPAPQPATVRQDNDAQATATLTQIEQLANAGQISAALTLCQSAQKHLVASAQLYYLWGLLSDSLGQKSAAEQHYRKALYIEPLHGAALSQLAALLRAQGDADAATVLEKRMKHKRT